MTHETEIHVVVTKNPEPFKKMFSDLFHEAMHPLVKESLSANSDRKFFKASAELIQVFALLAAADYKQEPVAETVAQYLHEGAINIEFAANIYPTVIDLLAAHGHYLEKTSTCFTPTFTTHGRKAVGLFFIDYGNLLEANGFEPESSQAFRNVGSKLANNEKAPNPQNN